MLSRSLSAVVPALRANGREGAIGELLAALSPAHSSSGHPAAEAVLSRERTASTAIGNHVAVPHAKWDGDFTIAVGVSADGVEFNAMDGKKVHVVFLVLSPRGRAVEHLKLLARIARLASDERFWERMKSAGSADAISGIIRAEEGAFQTPKGGC
ncbi:MAG: PTS sugar transporter subunit IIA [Nitrospinae bacterium]|nr:PTS sugar transporter subunit IIA [Nitrospinota bacterium]